MAEPNLSERQQKWFASVRQGLERDTGRSLAEWVEIARGCPETGHRARLAWFKTHYGLLQNRASMVLAEAFEPAMAWSDADGLVDALWTDTAAREIFEAVRAAAMDLPETIETARKGYTAWTRKVQFAAVKPRGRVGGVLMGLALLPEADPRLTAPGASISWSERLKSQLPLTAPDDVDVALRALVKAAWERS
jgi:hypothetical protein